MFTRIDPLGLNSPAPAATVVLFVLSWFVVFDSQWAGAQETGRESVDPSQIYLLRQQQRIQEAIPLAERYAAQMKREAGDSSLAYAAALHDLGDLYFLGKECPKTIDSLSRGSAIDRSILPPTHWRIYDAYKRLATCYQNLGLYPQALDSLRSQLAIEDAKSENPVRTLEAISDVSVTLGAFLASEEALNRAIRISEPEQYQNSFTASSLLTKLGETYLLQGKTKEAEAAWKRGLTLDEVTFRTPDPQRYDRAFRDGFFTTYGSDYTPRFDNLDSLSELFRDFGRYDEAGELLKRALSTEEDAERVHSDSIKRLGRGSDQVRIIGADGSTFRSLRPDPEKRQLLVADLYRSMDRAGEAATFVEGIIIGLQAKTERGVSSTLADAYESLGHLRFTAGNFTDAESLLHKAVLTRQPRDKPEERKQANTWSDVGVVRVQLRKLAPAEEAFEQAHAIRQRILHAGHPETRAARNNLYVVKTMLGRGDAQNYAEDAEKFPAVSVYFATDRKTADSGGGLSVLPGRGRALMLGSSTVRIPKLRRMGEFAIPAPVSVFGLRMGSAKFNPDRHFSVHAVTGWPASLN